MNVVNCLTMGAVTLPTGIIGNQVNQMSVGKNRKVSICGISIYDIASHLLFCSMSIFSNHILNLNFRL